MLNQVNRLPFFENLLQLTEMVIYVAKRASPSCCIMQILFRKKARNVRLMASYFTSNWRILLEKLGEILTVPVVFFLILLLLNDIETFLHYQTVISGNGNPQ